MLINMELTESSWLLVKNTNNVIGFIGGSSGKPSPITQREVDKIMARVQEGAHFSFLEGFSSFWVQALC
jgi:transcriptional antiterminator NusG